MSSTQIDHPTHVPEDRVRPFDLYGDAELHKCPFSGLSRLREGPSVFWTPDRRCGGAWMVTKAEDIRYVTSNPQIFSSREAAGFSQMVGENWDLIPLELDPPQHTAFRKVMNPVLAPPKVAAMTPGVVSRAIDLIEAFRTQGECEFMEAFGRPFPVSIFMQLMGLPEDQTDTFLQWEHELLHAADMGVKVQAATQIRDYLRELASERRANPTDDLASYVVQAEVDGRPFTDDEVMGALYLLFVGGLDTVASSLGFFFHHLATHPEEQAWLRANPDKIEKAVEELLRRFSVVSTRRRAVQDVDLGGAPIKAGDWVSVTYALGSLDPDEFDDPMETNLERKGVRHFAFAFGPHFCVGSHLARRELAVALREWLARIPQFRLKADAPLVQHAGGVFGVDHMVLEW